jgi:hypothetical protein
LLSFYLQAYYLCLLGKHYSQIAQLAELRTVNPLVVGSSPTLGAMTKPKYDMSHLLGRRIEIISCKDQYTKLVSGSQGKVTAIDSNGTVFAEWDDGSTLGLIPGVDQWKYI